MKEEAQTLRARRLGPLNVENEVIVAVAIEGCNGLGCVLLPVVVDEGESFALTSDLILGKVDPGDASERLEQLLKVSLLGVLGQVGDSDGGSVIG